MKDQTNISLKLFTEPAILQQIGTRRLAKLLDAFRDDLKAADTSLRLPPDPDPSTTQVRINKETIVRRHAILKACAQDFFV